MLSCGALRSLRVNGPMACPRPPQPQGWRPSAAAAAVAGRKLSPVSQGLLTVLRDELKIEKERYRTPEIVLAGPPSPFELQDKPNTNAIVLTGSYGSSEEVLVAVDLDDQDVDEGEEEGEEEEEGGDALPPVLFSVSMYKDSGVLVFKCETNGRYLRIREVSLDDAPPGERDGGEDDEEDEDEDEDGGGGMRLPPYSGPVFDELDETLQQALLDYLEERGITPEFRYYLMELVTDKLEVEYVNWLARMQRFVGK